MLFDMGEGPHLLELLDRQVSGLGAIGDIYKWFVFCVRNGACHCKRQFENGGLADN
jgi:hypothetical protein